MCTHHALECEPPPVFMQTQYYGYLYIVHRRFSCGISASHPQLHQSHCLAGLTHVSVLLQYPLLMAVVSHHPSHHS